MKYRLIDEENRYTHEFEKEEILRLIKNCKIVKVES